jgi:hypothetical protein
MENNLQTPPKNWLVESILVTILCCLPFGIAGIVNAAKVEKLFFSGDIEGANRVAADAKKWTKIGFFVGIGILVIYIIMYLVMGAALLGAMSAGSRSY